MRRIVLLVGAVVVPVSVVLLVGCGGGSEPAASSSVLSSDDIVFTRHVPKPDRSDLYVMRANGSRSWLLLRNAAEAAVLPDGRHIAFVRDFGIWVMQRDGSRQRKLTQPSARSTEKGRVPPVRDSDPAPACSDPATLSACVGT